VSQSITISDTLYTQLEAAARERGFQTIEQLLEAWEAAASDLRRRRDVVEQIDAVRTRMAATYGLQPDSVDLVREDRAR
jgi:hypothetical protein